MRAGMLAFVFGVAGSALGVWPAPSVGTGATVAWIGAAVLVAWGAWRVHASGVRVVCAVLSGSLLGIGWYATTADTLLAADLDLPRHEQIDRTLQVEILGIPERSQRRTVFQARVLGPTAPARVRLSWYGAAPDSLTAGSRWRLHTRLRPRAGYVNPGGFDYQRWLFSRRIGATGYVLDGEAAEPPQWAAQGAATVHARRVGIADAVGAALANHPQAALVQGLAVGVRSGMTDAQWQVLNDTGTGHLLAISGLHVGLAAGAAALVAGLVWGWWPGAPARIPVPVVRAVGACGGGFAYALLAGLTLPTQRALIMLGVFVIATVLRRGTSPWHTWTVAAVVVLLVDPLAPLGAGFWLSFGAVAIIVAASVQRSSPTSRWYHWVRTQCVISLALIPLLIVQFGAAPWISPVANALAIPVVGFAVVPPTLIGVAASGWLPEAAALCWQAAARVLEVLWPLLEALAEWAPSQSAGSGARGTVLWACTAGALAWLLPAGWPARGALSALLFLPLAGTPSDDGADRRSIHVLDTGPGLSVVVREPGSTWLYGAGPGGSLSGTSVGLEGAVPVLSPESPGRLVVPRAAPPWSGSVDDALHLWPDLTIQSPSGHPSTVVGRGARVELHPDLPDASVSGAWSVGLADCAGEACAAVRSPDGERWTTRRHGALHLRMTRDGVALDTERDRRGRPYHRWR